VDEVKLLELISKQYGIDSPEIMPGPRQFVAETFIIRVEKENKYFLKVIPQTNFPRKIIKSLPTLEFLVEVGIDTISNPIPTNDGSLFVEDNKYIYVLFAFIEGEQTFDYDNRLLAKFLAKLHLVSKEEKTNVERETFSSYVDELFPKTIKTAFQNNNDSVASELKEVLSPYQSELETDWETFQSIANECKRQSTERFVITHGDAPGNIIAHEGKIFVIDWDDSMFAPPERDIWFLKENKKFMAEYLRNIPGFEWNDKFYAYYVLWRTFDDLFGWIGEIVSDKSDEHKMKNLQDLKKDYFDWLRPLVRNL